MFEDDISYINKILLLRGRGFDVIENVSFEIIDPDTAESDTYDSTWTLSNGILYRT